MRECRTSDGFEGTTEEALDHALDIGLKKRGIAGIKWFRELVESTKKLENNYKRWLYKGGIGEFQIEEIKIEYLLMNEKEVQRQKENEAFIILEAKKIFSEMGYNDEQISIYFKEYNICFEINDLKINIDEIKSEVLKLKSIPHWAIKCGKIDDLELTMDIRYNEDVIEAEKIKFYDKAKEVLDRAKRELSSANRYIEIGKNLKIITEINPVDVRIYYLTWKESSRRIKLDEFEELSIYLMSNEYLGNPRMLYTIYNP